VDTKGDQKGTLEIDAGGEVKGMDMLSGEWKVSKLG
jgi:alpha-D-xyloside xylohydrolase